MYSPGSVRKAEDIELEVARLDVALQIGDNVEVAADVDGADGVVVGSKAVAPVAEVLVDAAAGDEAERRVVVGVDAGVADAPVDAVVGIAELDTVGRAAVLAVGGGVAAQLPGVGLQRLAVEEITSAVVEVEAARPGVGGGVGVAVREDGPDGGLLKHIDRTPADEEVLVA